MVIRPATPADVPAILPMVSAICSMHSKLDPARYGMLPDVVDRYARWLPARAVDPRSVLFIAEDGAAVVGFLVGTVESNIPIYTLKEFGFIHDVWVEPSARRQGAAKQLVEAAINRFRDIGVSQVRLETAALNEPARKLFASVGFRVGTIDMLASIDPPSR